eukprot:Skav225815  [mRNA]  locus=scaffold4730:90362:91934:- [translate_table: standard]
MLLVWKPDASVLEHGANEACVAIPVMQRAGGLLLAIPNDYLSSEAALEGAMGDQEGIIGPSRTFSAPLLEEDPEGGAEPVRVGVDCAYMIVDLSDLALQNLREYDPVIDPSGAGATAKGGDKESPAEKSHHCNPSPESRYHGISNPVDAVAARSPVAGIQGRQQCHTCRRAFASLPPVSQGIAQLPNGTSKAVALVGPPPKAVRNVAKAAPSAAAVGKSSVINTVVEGDANNAIGQALVQQSTALTALVAHLSQGDALTDLSAGPSQGVSLSTKGVARRERMQRDLAEGTSTYFMQVQQQMFKKMFPSKPIPKTEMELAAAGLSMTTYLERRGGFRGQRENAMVMWLVAHIMDAGANADYHMMKEYTALLAASLEQATLDNGWSIAFILSLLEEPPSQMFAEKGPQVSALGRPFAGLVPPSWSATALSYMKEVELLTNKKTESRAPKQTPKPDDGNQNPSPKRRPKFPKKPKAGGGESSPQ